MLPVPAKLALRGPWPGATSRTAGLATAVGGSIFSAYLVAEAGIELLAVACVLYAMGIPVYLWARRGERLPAGEKALAVCVAAAAVLGLCLMAGVF